MTAKSNVYIAGVGFSPSPSGGASAEGIVSSLVSAATKALLDAGITYDDVTRCVTSKTLSHGFEAFKAFDIGAVPLDGAEGGCELKSSVDSVSDRGDRCVLTVVFEESAAVALILASDHFLGRRPYLKDSSVVLSASDTAGPDSNTQPCEKLNQVCQMVWALRGWTQAQSSAARRGPFQYRGKSDHSFELSRADGKAIPASKEVNHKQDGKHRLGYNPAIETREIFQEDFEAVRACGRSDSQVDDRIRFDREGGDRATLARQQRYLAKL